MTEWSAGGCCFRLSYSDWKKVKQPALHSAFPLHSHNLLWTFSTLELLQHTAFNDTTSMTWHICKWSNIFPFSFFSTKILRLQLLLWSCILTIEDAEKEYVEQHFLQREQRVFFYFNFFLSRKQRSINTEQTKLDSEHFLWWKKKNARQEVFNSL